MIAHFDTLPPVAAAPAARYFRSTITDLIWKFEGELSFSRSPGAGWMPSAFDIPAMNVLTVEITAEEGEP